MNNKCITTVILLTVALVSAYQDNRSSFSKNSYPISQKRKISVTTILDAPYMMMKPNSAWLPYGERFEGYLADIIEKISEATGIVFEIKLARDGQVGAKLQDGEWTGVLGEVTRKEADVGAASLVVTDEGSEAVSFSEPYLSLRSSVLIRKTGRPSKKHRQHKHKEHQPYEYGEAGFKKQIFQNVLQNQTKSFKKIISLSHLLVTDYVIGVVKDSPSELALRNSSVPLYRDIWRRINDNKPVASFVNNLQEGLDRVRRERFALILESPMAEYQATRKPCELYAIEPFLDVMLYSFALQKDDDAEELRKLFNRELVGLKANGEMQSLYLKWWKDECFGSHLTENSDNTESELNRRFADPVSSSSRIVLLFYCLTLDLILAYVVGSRSLA